MSVVSVTEISGRGGEADERITKRHRRRFRVITNNPLDGDVIVRHAVGIPRVFDLYQTATEFDNHSTCGLVRVEEADLPTVWEVTCEYSNEQERPAEQNVENPLNRPPDVGWGFTKYERPIQRDLLGRPVLNSASEPFDPSLTVEDSRPTLIYERNEPVFNQALALLYQDAVNSDLFLGSVFPRQGKVNLITGNRQFENNIIFWRVRYELEFRREQFDYKILDRGFRDIDGKLFRDPVDQLPLSAATLLNGKGFALKDNPMTFLAGNIDAFQTTIHVNSTAGFPEVGKYEFQIKIDNEIMFVVNINQAALTLFVVRGWAGTLPAAHTDGSQVTLEPVYAIYRPYKELPFSALRIVI